MTTNWGLKTKQNARFQSCHCTYYVVKCNDTVLACYNFILYVVLYSFHFGCVIADTNIEFLVLSSEYVSNVGRLRKTVEKTSRV